jgi:photosystem II stability/assembly factor-like uncharacterized protein
LFHSTDGGDSWNLNRPLWDREERCQWFGGGENFAGIHSLCVDPLDPQRLTVGVSVGGVLTSGDGGDSWETRGAGMVADYMPPEQAENPNAQDPHCLVHCAAAPETMWVQHHNGIFVSRNAGIHWDRCTDVDPSTFGFAVAVHPHDGDTAWFVPG